MADDIVTRLREARIYNCYSCVEYGYDEECDCASRRLLHNDAVAEIERLQHAVDELTSAFQTLTDMGDDCPMCWDIFKKSGQPVYCYGHAIIAELEEARRG